MNSESLTRNQARWPAFLAYFGAILGSVILLIAIHEVGHYLAFQLGGYSAQIIVTPFFGITTSSETVLPQDMTIIALGGTTFNLTVALLVAICMQFTRQPWSIFLRTYSAMAFLVEGIVILAGFFIEGLLTDFSYLLALGWSPLAVLLLGLIFSAVGSILMYQIWAILDDGGNRRVLWVAVLNIPYILYFGVSYMIGRTMVPDEMANMAKLMLIILAMQFGFLALRILAVPIVLPADNPKKYLFLPNRSLKAHLSSKNSISLPQNAEFQGHILSSKVMGLVNMSLGALLWTLSFFALN